MWTFGLNTPFELLQKSNEFTLKGIANMIGCPTLDLEAQDDESFLGQPKMICDALICTKKYVQFTSGEGVEGHYHVVALSLANQRIFDWLEELCTSG
jgi:hypothetical protein